MDSCLATSLEIRLSLIIQCFRKSGIMWHNINMARNATSNKSKVVLEFDLNSQDQEVLTSAAGSAGLAAYLKACAEAYFHEYAQGGLLLTGNDMNRLKKAAGKDVESSDEILDLVEKSKGLKKGQNTYEITIDPALVDSFRHYAEANDWTIDEFLQSCWNHVHANGWLYTMLPDVYWVPLSVSEVNSIKTDGPVTSDEVLTLLRKAASN